MIDYEHTQPLGEEVSAIKLKALFSGLDIAAEVALIQPQIDELKGGSDKVVWTVPDRYPNLIFKLAEGSQIKQIPVAFKDLFQSFYEYVLPTPIEWQDIIFYRVQVQQLVELLPKVHNFYPNNKIKIYASHKAIDIDFLWQLWESYDEEFVIDFCKWQMETGVNNSNWGNADGHPRIFDYGSVRNENWREIALIRDGFYWENGQIIGGSDENRNFTVSP